MKNIESELQQAGMMIHENGICQTTSTMSCKCQRCNNVQFEEDALDEKQIEGMFKGL
jgi:hypothetical protein